MRKSCPKKESHFHQLVTDSPFVKVQATGMFTNFVKETMENVKSHSIFQHDEI